MNFAGTTAIGFFFGFALGVGCALAVLYSIYTGGYRAGVEDSLRNPPPERLRNHLSRARRRVSRQEATTQLPPTIDER
ncbi:MAG TPA: hypothetical protein VGD59_09650 [Acidisarcina sp.]